jgi:hypothetical protein
MAADLEAVDANVTIRVNCVIRGTYGGYPRRFLIQRMADLTPDGILVRPYWLIGRKFRVTEDILEAHVRPRNWRTDWNLRGGAGAYTADGGQSYLGMEVITCRTSGGIIEFAIPRADVPLMLHYISRRLSPSPKE